MRNTLHLASHRRTTAPFTSSPARRGCAACASSTRTSTWRGHRRAARVDDRRAAHQWRHPGAGRRDRRRPEDLWSSILLVRTLLPMIQLPPAGHWSDTRRASFVVDPRPLPAPADAATLVLERYLAAFGPASRRDVAAWSGAAQRDFAAAFERLRDRVLPRRAGHGAVRPARPPLPPADMELPPRLLGNWDQAMLAYADRERIMTPDLQALKLTLAAIPWSPSAGAWRRAGACARGLARARGGHPARRAAPRRQGGDPRGGPVHGARVRAGGARGWRSPGFSRPAFVRTYVRVVRRAPRPLRLLVPRRRLAARRAGGRGGARSATRRWR